MGRRIVRLQPKIEVPVQRVPATETAVIDRRAVLEARDEYVHRKATAGDSRTNIAAQVEEIGLGHGPHSYSDQDRGTATELRKRYGHWLVVGEPREMLSGEVVVRCRCEDCGVVIGVSVRSLLGGVPPCARCLLNGPSNADEKPVGLSDQHSVRSEPPQAPNEQKLVRWERPQPKRKETKPVRREAMQAALKWRNVRRESAQARLDLIWARCNAGETPYAVSRDLDLSVSRVIQLLHKARAQRAEVRESPHARVVAERERRRNATAERHLEIQRRAAEGENIGVIAKAFGLSMITVRAIVANGKMVRRPLDPAASESIVKADVPLPDADSTFVETPRAASQSHRATTHRNVEIQQRVIAGEAFEALAAEFGLSVSTVRLIVRKRTSLIPLAAEHPLSSRERALIAAPMKSSERVLELKRTVIDRRMTGETYRSIAEDLRISEAHAVNICRQAGLTKKRNQDGHD